MTEHHVQPGDTVRFPQEPHRPPHPWPDKDIVHFLESRGWHPEHGDRWGHTAKARSGLFWEQAMACEFYEFITLGGR